MSFCCEIWRTPFGNQEVSIIGKVSAPERSRQIRREIPEYLSMRGRVLKYWLLTLLRECPSTEAGFHPMWAHVGTFKHQQCMSCLCFGVKSTHGTLGSLFYRFFLPKDAKTGGRFFRASLALETSSFTLSGSTDVSRRFFSKWLRFMVQDNIHCEVYCMRFNCKEKDEEAKTRCGATKLVSTVSSLGYLTCARKGPNPRKMHLMVPKGVTNPARCRVCIGLFGRIMPSRWRGRISTAIAIHGCVYMELITVDLCNIYASRVLVKERYFKKKHAVKKTKHGKNSIIWISHQVTAV